jgi:hypothetical protein
MQGVKSESARGSDPPEMGGIFKSDSGFATLDLSTGKSPVFCEARQEGEAFGKKHLLCHPLAFPYAVSRLF